MSEQWKLVAGESVLGTLTLSESDMWNFFCAFEATEHFEAWKARFARKSELAKALETSDDEQLFDDFDALDLVTAPPHLRLVAVDGSEKNFGLLYVEGTRAGFRAI